MNGQNRVHTLQATLQGLLWGGRTPSSNADARYLARASAGAIGEALAECWIALGKGSKRLIADCLERAEALGGVPLPPLSRYSQQGLHEQAYSYACSLLQKHWGIEIDAARKEGI